MFTQKLNVNDTNRCKRNSFISFFVHFVMNIKALLNGIFCDFLNPGFVVFLCDSTDWDFLFL